MPLRVILHILGEDPIVAEMEHEPQQTDQFIKVTNLRKRDGKDVPNLADGVEHVIYPWHRITFLELLPDEESRESVIDFFRT